MITFKKAGAALLIASLLSVTLAPQVMAASKKKVGKITLDFSSDIRTGTSGGDVTVTSSGDNTSAYYIDSWEITNDEGDSWTRSTPPEIEIVLGVEDEEEYHFSSSSSSAFKLNMDRATKNRFDEIKFVKANREDGNATIILTVQLVFDKDADKSKATAPTGLQWTNGSDGIGAWNDVSTAKYYQVQLFKDNTSVSSIESSYETSYNFTRFITEPGSYCFKVRSVKSSNNAKSSWITSGTWTVSAEMSAAMGNTSAPSSGQAGSWQRAADGIRWWWINADGTSPASAWSQIDGKWYYFDTQGYMATGWINLNGVYYYLDLTTGAMYANARTPDNCWVNESGAWVPGA